MEFSKVSFLIAFSSFVLPSITFQIVLHGLINVIPEVICVLRGPFST